MTNIKYTNDGKKVLVVGKLNAEQTIVQEIFVSGGQEIPSGENFVVGSLHDQPAESWKAKSLRELEARYESERARLTKAMDDQRRQLEFARSKASAQACALTGFVRNSDPSQLDTLNSFMAGEITHLFVSGYSPEIIDWLNDDAPYDVDRWGGTLRLDGIKLVSLYGKSDGSLVYRLCEYRDGSGGCGKTILPAKSYQEALALAQAECERQSELYASEKNNHFSMDRWEKIEGIQIPEEARQKHQAIADAAKAKRIDDLKAELAKLEDK
tara:strand:- start:13494 stop:14300 length:807 start_codon:yes stop_codon:yes gene_type:complete